MVHAMLTNRLSVAINMMGGISRTDVTRYESVDRKASDNSSS